MTEKNERPKPPARRTGRTLGAARTTASPPPPPAAELAREQLAAEQALPQADIPPADHQQQAQPTLTVIPVDRTAHDRSEPEAAVGQASIAPGVQGPFPGPGQAPVPDQPAFTATGSDTRQESAGEQTEQQVQTAAPAVSEVQASQSAGGVSQEEPAHVPPAPLGTAQSAEVAVRSTAPPAAGGSAFPMRNATPVSRRPQDLHSKAAPSEGTPWAQGPGRPADIPEAAVVLNQRVITRESLDSSVPAALRLKRRIKRFALDNELDHLPIGDIVAVAMDEWLTTRGF
ncbi:hypothetical protein ABZU94_28030 [Streptomyces mirabilis]|uniref:hypothetical protein n=1 Tax=Streptomyces sp. NPDC005388 TaxID=3156717 RepID=UPI0033A36DF7